MGTLSKLPEEAKTACQAAALRYGVSGAVHPSDWIFWFLYNLAIFPSKLAAIETYFADGSDCARKLRSLIEEQRPIAGARILEFAAGYGRVTRHLRKVVPEAEVLACDIHPDAVTFVREELSTSTVSSAKLPEEFDLGQRFDVVFILSFFSHLPQSSWRRWLLALAAHTAADGLLIFTTHGHRSRLNLGNPTIGTDGFWFKPESEQQDLPGDEYGSSITLPHYVLNQCAGISDMRLVRFQEGFWWGHQDLYILRRSA
jgi:SAM-dependent methyltransferase